MLKSAGFRLNNNCIVKDTCASSLFIQNCWNVDVAIIRAYQQWNLPIISNIALDHKLYANVDNHFFLVKKAYLDDRTNFGSSKSIIDLYISLIPAIKQRLGMKFNA